MLQVRIRDQSGTHEQATDKDDVTVGRGQENDVVLPDEHVSRQHARLTRRDGTIFIEDLGGASGTQLNDRLLHKESVPVGPGDWIGIGPYQLSVDTAIPQKDRPSPSVNADAETGGQSEPSVADQPPASAFTASANGTAAEQAAGADTPEAALVPSPAINERVEKDWAESSAAQEAETAPGEPARHLIPHPPGAARIRLGRAPTSDLVLGSPRVSLDHAVIERDGADSPWVVTNAKGVNQTFVNNVPVRRRRLSDGDVIRIGPYRLVVTDGEIEYFDESAGITIQALDLTKRVGKKVILHGVSLVIQPRQFIAIVGVSGSGKTTLLNALSGIRPASTGQVLLNGYSLYDQFTSLRAEIGYVPQDDIVHRELPVERALDYAARLRMPADTSKVERRARVDQVIAELGIEQQRKTVIGKLSGGQRKRVSIGVELLTRPPLFFLDEPTSGLDPVTDSHMMDLLRQLADQGRTVVLVTHATRDIALCDRVVFLTQGGRLAFFGTPQEALDYFGVADFEDIYDQIENQRSPEEWEERFRASPTYQAEVNTPLVRLQATTLPSDTRARPRRGELGGRVGAGTGTLRQFGILTRRYIDTTLRDRKRLAILLLQAPIIGLLMWGLFNRNVFNPPQNLQVFAWQAGTGSVQPIQRDPNTNRLVNVPPGADLVAVTGRDCARLAASAGTGGTQVSGADCHVASGNGNNVALKAAQLAFLLAALAVWLGTLSAITEISKEHAIYRRERMVNLRIVPYIASKFAVLWFLVILQTAMLLGVTAGYIHFPTHMLAETWVSLLLGGAASVAVALAVSAAVTNADRAIVAAPLLMVPQILFAGGLTPIQDLGVVKPLSALVATRWCYEALGRVFGVVKLAGIPEQFPQTPALTGELYTPWIVLGAFIVVSGVLALLLQKLKDRR